MTNRIKSYLRNVLEDREKLVCSGGLHWIYLSSGTVWFAILAAIGGGADYALWHYFGQHVPRYESNDAFLPFGLREGWIGILFTTCGAVIFMTQFLRYLTTAVFVSSLRVILKTGWIKIKIDSTDISDVRAIHVDQGWLGRFLNYGKIHLDCRFIQDVDIPYVKDAYKFTRQIQHIKSEIEGRENIHSPMDEHRQPVPPQQTIIQINTGAGTEIVQKDDRTLVIKPHVEAPAIAHNPHDEILDDFNKSKVYLLR